MGRVGRLRAGQWGTGLGFPACLWWVWFLAVWVGDTGLYPIWCDKGYRMVDKWRGTGEILTEGHRVGRPQMAQMAQMKLAWGGWGPRAGFEDGIESIGFGGTELAGFFSDTQGGVVLSPIQLGGEKPGASGKGHFGGDWCRLVKIGVDWCRLLAGGAWRSLTNLNREGGFW